MRASLVAVLCLATIALAFAAQPAADIAQFKSFVTSYNKRYEAEDLRVRYEIFQENLLYINTFNAEENGVTLAVNKFADLTHGEFVARYTGMNVTAAEEILGMANPFAEETVAPRVACPASTVLSNSSCDWRAKNIVNPVKNQAACGSCWAFSTTGSLEPAVALKTGTLYSFSEQQLVDCSTSYGNHGCSGGLMTNSFNYIKANGLVLGSDYPYTAKNGKCEFDTAKVVAASKVSGFQNIQRFSEEDLTDKITTVGPISVAIDAGRPTFRFYKSGVYYEKSCSSTYLNHGVTAVGYGSLNGDEYYIVRNSWGQDWGDQGHILMAKNKSNNCGIATMATFPLL